MSWDKDEWIDAFELVSRTFRDKGISHAFIKMLTDPFAMSDIDVLIPKPSEIRKSIKALKHKGFSPRRAGRLLHPMKFICQRDDGLSVDIHPDAEWNRTKVADGKEIVARSMDSKVLGVKAITPAPEDEFYLIATHAFIQHGRIKEEELANVALLLNENEHFSWRRVKSLTDDYGTSMAVYAFLRGLRIVSEINDDVIESFSSPLSGFLDAYFSGLPIQFPRRFNIYFLFAHTPKLIGRASVSEITFDALSHFMRLRKPEERSFSPYGRLDERIAMTSDYRRGSEKISGHPAETHLPELVEVPWLKVKM